MLGEDAGLYNWQVLQLVAVEERAMKCDGHVARSGAVDGTQDKLLVSSVCRYVEVRGTQTHRIWQALEHQLVARSYVQSTL